MLFIAPGRDEVGVLYRVWAMRRGRGGDEGEGNEATGKRIKEARGKMKEREREMIDHTLRHLLL